MSSLRRGLVAAAVSVVLIPVLSAGQAHAQCQGGQRGSQSSLQAQGRGMLRGQFNMQNQSLSTARQVAGLQTLLPAGVGLQAGALQLNAQLTAAQQQAALQIALVRTTNLLNAAVQQGASPALINQLSALQQQISGLLGSLQSSGSVQGY
jgi:hypothetical protein